MNFNFADPSLWRSLTQFRQKRARIKSHVRFLLTCKTAQVFPNFMRLPLLHRTGPALKALGIFKQVWLREELKERFGKLDKIEKQCYSLHLGLSKKLNTFEWDYLDSSTTAYCDRLNDEWSRSHNQKLQKLKDWQCGHG